MSCALGQVFGSIDKMDIPKQAGISQRRSSTSFDYSLEPYRFTKYRNGER